MPEKLCKGPCEQVLPATTEYFWASPTNRDHLVGKCKTCQGAQNRRAQHIWYEQKRADSKQKQDEKEYYKKQKAAAKIEKTEPIDDFDFGCKRAGLAKPPEYISSTDEEIHAIC
jgi:hypothetical protein